MPMTMAKFCCTMCIVARESLRSSGIIIGSSRLIITSLVSIAISVDLLPSEMPTSAYASAGASLMPSPTITTPLPCVCKRSTASAFCSGRSCALKPSTPICSATARACGSISPVRISMSPTPS